MATPTAKDGGDVVVDAPPGGEGDGAGVEEDEICNDEFYDAAAEDDDIIEQARSTTMDLKSTASSFRTSPTMTTTKTSCPWTCQQEVDLSPPLQQMTTTVTATLTVKPTVTTTVTTTVMTPTTARRSSHHLALSEAPSNHKTLLVSTARQQHRVRGFQRALEHQLQS